MCQTFVVSNPKLRLVSFETVIESGLITITLVSAVVNATEWKELTNWISGKKTQKQAFDAIDASWSKA